MSVSHRDLRKIIQTFWEESPRNHKEVPPAPLVLKEDPTTLFTSSGMQQLVPYLMGEVHPLGKKLYDIQPSIRTQDIEEVGDNRHDTFFEMIGNWSLGDYFKDKQLPWVWELFTEKIGFPKEKLFVTVFEGNESVPKDEESAGIWKKLSVPEDHIYYYGVEKNWWSRSGTPEKMPAGEIGGPDSEIFYDFGTPHNPEFGDKCHPNCDCGRFMEIGNSVFIQYKKMADGSLQELPQKNVDYGGGMERILAAVNNTPDVFMTDLYSNIVGALEHLSGKKYADDINKPTMRIIADHIKTATFLIKEGTTPSNKLQGYILRRILRRAAIKLKTLKGSFEPRDFSFIARQVVYTYKGVYFENTDEVQVTLVIDDEMKRFAASLERGLKEINKTDNIEGKKAFDIYQSFGFPLELIEELAKEKGQNIDRDQFYTEFEKHKTLSRTASVGMFKGGLADNSEQVLKYHTATHLLHQALFDVMGDDIRQEGSNITGERLRFDFYSSKKPEKTEIEKVAEIVNEKIDDKLPMRFKIMEKDEAVKVGARSFFKEKYPEKVKVYYIGGKDDEPASAYSKEFCGGPHVKNTSEIGKLEIYKFEKIGSNLYRIYAR